MFPKFFDQVLFTGIIEGVGLWKNLRLAECEPLARSPELLPLGLVLVFLHHLIASLVPLKTG